MDDVPSRPNESSRKENETATRSPSGIDQYLRSGWLAKLRALASVKGYLRLGLDMVEQRAPRTESATALVAYLPECAREHAELSQALRFTHSAITRYSALQEKAARLRPSPTFSEAIAGSLSAVRRELALAIGVMRTRQLPPERVLVVLKELLAMLPYSDHEVRFETQREIITWAIEDYYSEPARPASGACDDA